MNAGYVYVWEFVVAPGHVRAFEEAYGPEGHWVRLFRRGTGHLRTDLHRDLERPERYLTIDHWASRASFEAFRAEFAREFEELDARCERLTLSERVMGHFEPRG
jgi:quinol monooxygenase YgiN